MCGVMLRELSYAGDAWEASVGAGRRPARMPEPCAVNSTDMGHFTLRVQALAAEVMQRAADVRARPLSDFQPSGTNKLKLARQQQQVSDIHKPPTATCQYVSHAATCDGWFGFGKESGEPRRAEGFAV